MFNPRRWFTAILLTVTFCTLAACELTTWRQFTSSEGGFSFSMPGIPEEEIYTLNTAAGPIDMQSFAVEEDDIAYAVAYSDYPDEIIQSNDPQTMLDGSRDGAVANTQGKLLSELIIELNGHPGREVRIEVAGGKGILRARIYLVEARLYQVMVATGKEDAFSKDITRFMDSFELIGR